MTPYMEKIPRRHETSEGYQQKLSIKSSTFNGWLLLFLISMSSPARSHSLSKTSNTIRGSSYRCCFDSPSQSRMCFGDAWQAEHLTQVGETLSPSLKVNGGGATLETSQNSLFFPAALTEKR
ncbi:hypothetical protein TNCV_4711681 [Trichonephila clavipes]|nr:hypothetical protein TNCV_4711681 [Trichonephila clavipes]